MVHNIALFIQKSINANVGINTSNPSAELDVNGTTKSFNVRVTSTSEAINASTGALQVSGGAGIAKNLYVDGGLRVDDWIIVNGGMYIREIGSNPLYRTIFSGGDQSSDINYTLPTTYRPPTGTF
jgi:hypothetical protein